MFQLDAEKKLRRVAPQKAMTLHASDSRASRSRSPKKGCRSLGEVVLCTQTCTISTTLGDACDQLIASGHTGTLVTREGEAVGVITENDILAALMDGIDRDIQLDLWLRGGKARLPGCIMNALTLNPTVSLLKAAERMADQAEKDSGFACHHLLVSNASMPHVVSDLDVVTWLQSSFRLSLTRS